MAFGISALNAHLNNRTSPFDRTLEIDWSAFKAWNNNKLPEFAGRYFLGPSYLWAHGEGTDVHNGAQIPKIVPIQKADKKRQETKSFSGEKYGNQDAMALCNKIAACLDMKELTLPKKVAVFLEVESGTILSPEYWASWAWAVSGYMYFTFEDVNLHGTIIPTLKTFSPFLPCLCCQFTKTPSGKYAIDANVKKCLDDSGKKISGSVARCRGVWAIAADTPAYHVPEPALDWTVFEPIEQPQGATEKVSVPVLFWRYFHAEDPAVPAMDQFDRYNLDAVAPAAVNSMLKVETWTLATQNAAGNDSVLTPTQFGVDRGASLKNHITALVKRDMKIPELPSTHVNNAGHLIFLNNGVNTGGLKGKTTFVGRYYTGRPIDHRDIKPDEALKISQQGAQVVTFFQGKAPYDQVTNYLLTPNQGRLDALAAFSYAAEVMEQPPHTPIYFALDVDVNSAGGISVLDIESYFRDINDGYIAYLNDRRTFMVSGVAQTPAPGVVYTHNGASWTVIFGDLSGGSGTLECWRSVGAAEPTAAGTLTKNGAGAGGAALAFSSVSKNESIPYYIGVYSSWNVMDMLYSKGLADYFWQAWPMTWGEKTQANRFPNLKIWPHANVWQVLLAQRFSVGPWALPENKQLIEACGGINVSVVVGSDGLEYLCIKDHVSSVATKPITGANAGNFWVRIETVGMGVAWADAKAFKAPTVIIGTDGTDYACIDDHTASASTQPTTGAQWANAWVGLGINGLGVAWAAGSSYKSGKGPVDLDVAWGDTGGWKK